MHEIVAIIERTANTVQYESDRTCRPWHAAEMISCNLFGIPFRCSNGDPQLCTNGYTRGYTICTNEYTNQYAQYVTRSDDSEESPPSSWSRRPQTGCKIEIKSEYEASWNSNVVNPNLEPLSLFKLGTLFLIRTAFELSEDSLSWRESDQVFSRDSFSLSPDEEEATDLVEKISSVLLWVMFERNTSEVHQQCARVHRLAQITAPGFPLFKIHNSISKLEQDHRIIFCLGVNANFAAVQLHTGCIQADTRQWAACTSRILSHSLIEINRMLRWTTAPN